MQASLDEVRHLNGELASLQMKHGMVRGPQASLSASPSHQAAPLMGTQPWSPSGHHIIAHLDHKPGNVLVSGPQHAFARLQYLQVHTRQSQEVHILQAAQGKVLLALIRVVPLAVGSDAVPNLHACRRGNFRPADGQ